MKTNRLHLIDPQANERGSATLIFIGLLAIMIILVTVNGRALTRLRHEIKAIEQHQVKRLEISLTNTPSTAISESK